ncbi:hypothetical protein AAC387_Pa11g0267 [Persea americana]
MAGEAALSSVLQEFLSRLSSGVGNELSQSLISDERETFSKVIESETCGRDDEKEKLIDSLLNSGNEEVLSVIPIVGMGGLGKTTLAQLVYSHEKVVTHFGARMWVYVSQDFIVKGLLEKILKSANGGKTEDQSSMDQLQTSLGKELSGKRYLLVLDDVWNEDHDKWDKLRTALECGAMGSKILVTTRSDIVAGRMNALSRPPLGTLSEDESWTLFEKVADPPLGFVSIGKEIVRKCGGVPLAIKTLGGMLRNETSAREWQSVRDGELWKQTNDETLRALDIRLQKWPKYMKRMISLRHIEFDTDCPLPKGIGELTFLRTLPKFIIAKESGARIEELKGLNLLWGNIHIGGLDNIVSVGCAGEADLKAKKHVISLTLSWSGDETVAAEGNAKEVIEVLEPHSDLEELSVKNYMGLGFPSWMVKKLTNLKKISLSSCKRCEQLPPLGQLDFLESLEIDTMGAVEFGLCHFKFNKELQV